MKSVQVEILNAFVDNGEGGNPAGVVLDASALDADERQRIAARLGFSETAFVSPSTKAHYHVEYYTPNQRVELCGHATVATFAALGRSVSRAPKRESSLETAGGSVLNVSVDNGLVFLEQHKPAYEPLSTRNVATSEDILRSLGLTRDDLVAGREPTVASTGGRFVLVPLSRRTTLSRVRPDQKAIAEITEALDAAGYYVIAPGASFDELWSRMFAPRLAIEEESATGMGAGPAAAWARDHGHTSADQIIVRQGHYMTPPSPSELIVHLGWGVGGVERVRVGGRAAHRETVTLTLDRAANA